MNIDRNKIWGLVLAGGRGSRVQGQDKGLLLWRGKPLISYVLNSVCNQVDQTLISCNRNLEQYSTLGYTCIPDLSPGYEGPLSALRAVLPRLTDTVDYIFVAPCDSPEIPEDIVSRLCSTGDRDKIRYVHDGQRDQYLIALIPVPLLVTVEDYLQNSRRSVAGWYEQADAQAMDFSDCQSSFSNMNSMEDFGTIAGK